MASRLIEFLSLMPRSRLCLRLDEPLHSVALQYEWETHEADRMRMDYFISIAELKHSRIDLVDYVLDRLAYKSSGQGLRLPPRSGRGYANTITYILTRAEGAWLELCMADPVVMGRTERTIQAEFRSMETATYSSRAMEERGDPPERDPAFTVLVDLYGMVPSKF